MTTLQTLPGEERHGAKGDRQPAGVGSASAGVGGRESHMWRLLEQEAEGEILLFVREGMGSHLGLRCCCLKSWWVHIISQLLLRLQGGGASKPSFILSMGGNGG